jgi:hypothetical protein
VACNGGGDRLDSRPMSAVEYLRELLQHADARATRSTVMKSMGWAMAMLLPCLLYSASTPGMLPWVPALLAWLTGTAAVIYFAAFVYFSIRAPDRLQSERFTLKRLEIERTTAGDNVKGFLPGTAAARPVESVTVGKLPPPGGDR